MNAVASTNPVKSAGALLLESLLREVAQLPKPWLQTPEREQQVVIDRLRASTEKAVRNLVQSVAASDYPHIAAMVESVTFKDGVKATLKLTKENGTHELADRTGSQVIVTMIDPMRYLEGIERIRGAADQPDMFHEEPENPINEIAEHVAAAQPDTLHDLLTQLRVNVDREVAHAWTEQERVVVWEWANAYAENADTAPARPHWLPMPDSGEVITLEGEGELDDDVEQTLADLSDVPDELASVPPVVAYGGKKRGRKSAEAH